MDPRNNNSSNNIDNNKYLLLSYFFNMHDRKGCWPMGSQLPDGKDRKDTWGFLVHTRAAKKRTIQISNECHER